MPTRFVTEALRLRTRPFRPMSARSVRLSSVAGVVCAQFRTVSLMPSAGRLDTLWLMVAAVATSIRWQQRRVQPRWIWADVRRRKRASQPGGIAHAATLRQHGTVRVDGTVQTSRPGSASARRQTQTGDVIDLDAPFREEFFEIPV